MSVHIRHVGSMDTFCGQAGSTISLEHYRKDPSGHASQLPLCVTCALWVRAEAADRRLDVHREKQEQAQKRKVAEGPAHQCLPPRWPDTQDLRRCTWFGHRVAVSFQCCRYVLLCMRCRRTLADLPRGEQGVAKWVDLPVA